MDYPPAFVCPRCGKASWNRNDGFYGWCGACKDYTAPPRYELEDPPPAAPQ